MLNQFDYAKSAATADRLLKKFGQTGAIRRTSASGGDNPWDPESPTTIDHPCTLAILPINLQDAGKDVGGTLIKASDKRILVSVEGLTITPTTTDHVVTAAGVYIIVKNSTLSPAGIPVIHDIVASQ
jgi:hypothetical protein